MGNLSESFDIEDLMSYGDDLISLLNAKNGFEVVSQSFEDLKALRFVCDEDLNQTQRSIQDCKKKLVACKKKTEEASCGDDDVELAEELKDLNAQWMSVDEQRQSVKRKERDDLRAEKMLSMYASVTKVIPEVEDPSKISGYMVDREKKVIEKFQFETNKMTVYETCNSIWSIINKQ
ncbi:BnaA01g32240D [Brassica napus]|uniref:BnaA01g32240D protein n=1 Tax=Brassica napus TaxID=3708 RepID=A0A078J0I8_BRANA|nr:BnaA01g32240D [Brassica napus]